MEQFIEFAGNHLALFVALIIISALLAQNLWASTSNAGGAVDSGRATELINREEAVVVDVRAMADFAKGHIINAVNIPSNGFKEQIKQLEKYKDSPIIIYCSSGANSGASCKLLRKEGFEKVHQLRGGLMAWQSANLPISQKKK